MVCGIIWGTIIPQSINTAAENQWVIYFVVNLEKMITVEKASLFDRTIKMINY